MSSSPLSLQGEKSLLFYSERQRSKEKGRHGVGRPLTHPV